MNEDLKKKLAQLVQNLVPQNSGNLGTAPTGDETPQSDWSAILPQLAPPQDEQPVANLNIAPISEDERVRRVLPALPVTNEGVSETPAPTVDPTFLPNADKTGFNRVPTVLQLNLPQPQTPQNLPQIASQMQLPSLARDNSQLAQNNAQSTANTQSTLSPLGLAQSDYQDALTNREPAGKWHNALFQGVQIANNVLNGLRGQQMLPQLNLTDARQQNRVGQAARVLAPLQQMQDRENQQAKFESDQRTAEQNRINSAERIAQQDRRLNQSEQKNADNEYNNGFRRAMSKLKLGYKRGTNPQLDEELKRYGIDVEQWDDNKRTFWQGQNLMTFDQNGDAVAVKNEKGEPVTDATRAPVEVNYNGQKYTVSNTVAYQGATNTGYRNTQIENQNVDDLNDYQKSVNKWENDVKESGGKVSVIDNELVGLSNRDAELNQQEETLQGEIDLIGDNPLKKEEKTRKQNELAQIQKERRDNATKINAKKGELSNAKQVYEGLQKNKPVKPKPRQRTEVPTNTGKTVPKEKDPLGIFQ